MNVLGICGSPHPQGNTAYALRHALEVIEKLGAANSCKLAEFKSMKRLERTVFAESRC